MSLYQKRRLGNYRMGLFFALIVLVLFTSVLSIGVVAPQTVNPAINAPLLVSWNPAVSCAPTLTTLEHVLGNNANSQGGANYVGGGFELAAPNQDLTNPQTWLFSKRGLPNQISCTYTVNGTIIIPSFVEMHNVRLRIPEVNEDCTSTYAPFCDTTVNLEDPACPSFTTNPYLCRIHVEIDQSWKNAGFAPPNYPNSTQLIDVQGYVYWDPQHSADPSAAAHSYSGWELHPLSAWRYSNQPNADFWVAASQTSLIVSLGSSNVSTINVGAFPSNTGSAFAGTFTLTTSISGAGTSPPVVSFLNSNVFSFPPDFGSGTPHSILSISAPVGTSRGMYTVTVTGASGGTTHSTTVTVNAGNVSFVVSATPAQFTVNVGSSGSSTIKVQSVNGFSGAVNLTATPSGLTSSFTPPTVNPSPGGSATSNMTVSAPSTVAPSRYTVTVTGRSGPLSSSTSLIVNVVDFILSASPTQQTIHANSTGTAIVSLQGRNNFTGVVSLSASVSPSNPPIVFPPQTSFNPQTVSLSQTSPSGTSNLTISTFLLTSRVTYTIKVIGTLQSIVRSTSVFVTVTNGTDFAISTSPDALNIVANDTSTSTVTVVSQQGFSGTVSLSFTVAPALTNSLSASLTATSVTVTPAQNGRSTLIISTTGLTTAANYTITVTGNWTGSGGSLSHSAFVRVEVSKFTLSSNPASMTVLASSQGTSIISVSIVGHFSGTVTLNAVVASPLSASLSPGSISAPGGTSTLTVTTTSDTSSGGKTVTITGTSGKLSYVLKVQVTVAKFLISKPIPNTLLFSSASSQTSTVTLQSFGGFSGTVSLVATVAPNIASSPTTQLNPTSVTLAPNGSNSSTLTVTTTSSTPYRNYTITVIATYNTLSQSVNMTVAVINFSLTGPAGPLRIPAGSLTNTTITMSLNGFSGTVCLSKITPSSSEIGFSTSPPYNPPSSPCVPVSDGGTGSVKLTVFTSPSAAAATRTITVVATSGTKTSNTLVITIKVGRFSVTTSPNSVSVLANTTYAQTITITSLNEFSGDVTLSCPLSSTAPVPPTISCNPLLVTLSPNGTINSSFQISTTPTTSDGTSTLTISGTFSGPTGSQTSNPVNVAVHVIKFNIVANPATLSFAAGTPAMTTLNVTSLPPNTSGFAGTVNIFVSTSSPSITASPNSPAITLTPGSWQTDVLNIGSSTPNNYIVFVKATASTSSGSYSKTIQVTVTVTPGADFSIGSTPVSPNPIPAGSSASSTVTITSVGSFSGTVTLSGVVQQSSIGITITFQPNPVSVPNTGGSSSMTIATTRSTLPGNYNIIVTGTNAGGTPSRTASVPFAVSAPTLDPTTTSVSCSGPVVVNQASTCTATVTDTFTTPTPPTGTVSFTTTAAGTFSASSCTLSGTGSSATCSVTFTPNGSGTDPINGAYSGDTTHATSSGSGSITVNPRTSSTTVSCTTPVVVGQASTCTATVADTTAAGTAITPTGTVSFTTTASGTFSAPSCTLAATGSCSVTFTPTATGTDTITGTYGGDTVHSGSNGSGTIVVNQRATSTGVVCSPAAVPVNQLSTCTATVSDTSPGTASTPTGSVAFTSTGTAGTFSAPSCALAAGTCSVTFTPSATGTATINGVYSGDTTHATSNGSGSVTGSLRTTSTTVSCVPNAVTVNQATTCTATVADTNGAGSTTPTGTVSFTQTGVTGSFTPTSCTLASGSCSVQFTGTTPGTATITGTYSGDAVHATSSGQTTVGVGGVHPTTTSVSCAPNPVIVTQPTTCTATVTDTFAIPTPPTGTVSFTTTAAGTFSAPNCTLAGTVSSTQCSVTFTPAAIGSGTATINAAYNGDTTHGTSSGSTNVTINPRPATETLSCTSPVEVGQASTCTATVTDTGPGTASTPSGTVSFTTTSAGTFNAPSCTLAAGTCSVTFTPSATGTDTINGAYSGDTTHNASSGSGTIVVNPRTTSTTISCTTPVVVGQASTCTATVADTSVGTPSTPTGTVSFTTPAAGTFSALSCTLAAGTCSVTFTPSASGTNTINGAYSSDATHAASTGSGSIAVNVRTTSTVVNCVPSSVNANTATTCTATVSDTSPPTASTPTGAVSFTQTGVTGTFSAPSCALNTGSCSVTFTPTTTGNAVITGTYSGDTSHATSSGQFTVVVTQLHTTTTGVSCTSPVVVNQASPCTATVTDTTSTGAASPSGSVSLTSSGAAGTLSAPSCSLVAGSGATATCSVSFAPSATGTATITGNYNGDTTHGTSSGSGSIIVNPRTTATSVNCSPSTMSTGQTTTCTATVTDTSTAGTVINPTGSVTFSQTGVTGSFSGNPCTLVAGTTAGTASCQATFSASTSGNASITAAYNGDTVHSSSTSGAFPVTVNSDPTTTTVNCNPSSVPANTPASCTATVKDTAPVTATPTGIVSFYLDSSTTPFSSCTLTSIDTSSASCSVTFTPAPGTVGTHTINATYGGDVLHPIPSSGSTSVTVAARQTSTSISCSSPVTVGTQSSCTVTVSDSSPTTFVTPTGSFSLVSNNTAGSFSGPCALSGTTASATCTVGYTPTAAGGHRITANYPGDPNHTTSSSSSDISTTPIPPHPTSTSVNCQTPLVVNQASTCTATVADTSTIAPTTPTGTVSFVSNGFPGTFDHSSCPLTGTGPSAGCSVNFTPSSAGTASITASYGNDATHSSSTGTSNSVIVNLRTTSTSVQCATPVNVNQPSNCTATVTDSSTLGSPLTPAGTVNFGSTGAAGGFTGSPCTLVAGSIVGTASCGATFTASAPGTATVIGTYSPAAADTAHSGSTSAGFGITVNQTVQPTTTSVSCLGPVVAGQASTCTATVSSTSTSGATTPTGTVAFSSTGAAGSFSGSPCTLVAGSTVGTAGCNASFTPSATGTASISATYTPASTDTTHSGSTSSPTNLIVNSRSTSTAVSCSSPFVIGVASQCTATVTDTSPGTLSTPTGSVTWTSTGSGSLSAPTCNLTAGATTGTAICSVNFTPSAPGTSTVTGAYGGDTAHGGSTSPPFMMNTGSNGTSTSVSCTSPVTVGQSSTCTARVNDTSTVGAITPSGTVSFSASGTATGSFVGNPCSLVAGATGKASCTVQFTPSAAGTASISATYNGDTSHTSSGSTAFTLTVNGDFGISASPTSVSIDAGLSGSSIITITSNSFAGSVALSITSPSNGLVEAFSVNPVTVAAGGTSSSNMTITVPPRQAAGTYLITVTGTSGTLSHSTTITVNVADFQISAGPVSPSAINPSSQGSSTISVAPVNGFTDTVNLSVSASSPAGLVCAFTLTGIQGGSGTSSLSCSAPTAADYTVTVTGTVTGRGGSTSHLTPPVTFHVVDFRISASPNPDSFSGSQGSMTVTVISLNSFQGTVNLAWVVSPSTGMTISCQTTSLPLPPTPDSTPCQLTASTPGFYSVNVTGTSGSLSHSTIVTVNAGDFSISGPTTPIILNPGSQGKPIIVLNSQGGFSGSVSLSATISPNEPSIQMGFNPATPSLPANGSTSSTLTVSTSTLTPAANYNITVTGTSGSIFHQIVITVSVQDFGFSSTPDTLSLQTGSTSSTVLTLTSQNGFAGTVNFAISSSGVGATPGQPSIQVSPGPSSTTSLTIFAQGSRVGTYSVFVTAKSGTTISHQITVTVFVTDFQISSRSSVVTVQAGSSGTAIIDLTGLNGFSGVVNISALSTHSGLNPTLSPTQITLSPTSASGTSTLTVQVDSTVQTGTYTVTVTGSSQSLSHPISVSVSVNPPPDFSLQANPGSLSIVRGSGQSSTIIASSINGFSGTVSLLASISPTGPSVAMNPGSVTLTPNSSTSASLAVSTDASTPTGTYVVTVTGNLTHPVRITVTVGDFTLQSSKGVTSPITIQSGSSDTATITVASQGGFGGSISFTSSSTPLSPSFGPNSVNLIAGSYATSLLTINSGSAPPGPYTLTVFATSPGSPLSHNINLTINIVDFGMSPSSFSTSFPSGSSSTIALNLTSLGGFSATVSIGTQISSAGLSGSCTPNSVPLAPGGKATSSCKFSSTTVGQYTVTITGSSGSLQHTVVLSVAVGQAQDFSISANPTSLVFPIGSTNSSIITLGSINGFNNTIMLTVQTSLSGATTSISPPSVTLTPGGSQTSTLTVGSPVATTFTVTVIASFGSLQHSVTIPVRVVDFSLLGPTTLSMVAQSTSSTDVTVSSIQGFSGTVSLTVSVQPSGLSAGLNPPSVSIQPSGSQRSTLSLTSSTSALDYTVTITGSYGGSLVHTWTIAVHVTDFSISANPTALTIQAGTAGTSQITLGSLNGFAGTVFLSPSGPTGISSNLNPNSLVLQSSGGTAISSLTITVSSSTSPNPYTVTVVATGNGLSHQVTFSITVTPSADFTIAPVQSSLIVQAGSSNSTGLNLTSLNGFQCLIALSTVNSAASLSPSSVNLTPNGIGSATLTVASSAASTFTVSVTATCSSPSLSHSASVSVIVVDFRIAAPSTLKTPAGIQLSSDITFTSLQGYSATIDLFVSPSQGLSAFFASPSVTLTPNQQVPASLTVSAQTAGTYSVTVTGSHGSLIHSATITVQVTDFSIQASQSSISIQAGQSGSTPVFLTATNGFTGQVSLSASVQPLGPSASMAPNSVAISSTGSASSTIQINVPAATPTGTYTIIVVASSPGLSHNVQVSVIVGQAADFSISSSFQSLTIPVGQSGSATITITSLNNFNGIVSLSDNYPTLASLSPGSVTPPVNGAAPSTLTINIPSSTPAETFTVTVTGTYLSLSHSVQITISVVDFRIQGPSSINVQAGVQGTGSIILTSLQGFSGTVTLSVTPPTGLSASLSAGSVTLTSDGSAPVSLFVSSGSATTFSVTIIATSGSLSHSLTLAVQVVDFSITNTTPTLTIPVGSSASTSLNLASLNGFCCTVSISAPAPAPGITTSPSSIPVSLQSGGTASQPLTVYVTSSAVAGNYQITVSATGSGPFAGGGQPHTVTIAIVVTDFIFPASLPPLVLSPGSTGSTTVTVTSLNGFTGTVDVSITVSTNVLNVQYNPQHIAFSNSVQAVNVTLTVLVPSYVQTGAYTITLRGASGTTLTHQIPQTLFVVQFGISANPSATVIQAGTSITSVITLQSQSGFTGTVVLISTTTGPSGGLLVSSLTPSQVDLAPGVSVSSSLTLTGIAAGNYQVIVNATSGPVSNFAKISVTVVDFLISTNTNSLSFPAGGSGTASITLESLSGFSGNVNLTATVSPKGPEVSVNLAVASLSGGQTRSITLMVLTNGTVAQGTYTVTVVATVGTVSRQVVVTLALAPPPALNAPNRTLSVNPGVLLTFYVNASDTDPSLTPTIVITYSPNPLPAGASFATFLRQGTPPLLVGAFNWKPTAAQGNADYNITFTARDSKGGVTVSTVTIHVVGVSPSSGLLGTLGNYWYVVIAAVGAVATVVGDRFLRQRKAKLALSANRDS